MSFTLANVVPWGRSFDEYVAMFALSANDLRKRILGCGDGPSSFNALLTRQGGYVVSVDPIYRFSAEEVRSRIRETYAEVMEQTRKNMHEFTWTSIRTVDELGRVRMAAMALSGRSDFVAIQEAVLSHGSGMASATGRMSDGAPIDSCGTMSNVQAKVMG